MENKSVIPAMMSASLSTTNAGEVTQALHNTKEILGRGSSNTCLRRGSRSVVRQRKITVWMKCTNLNHPSTMTWLFEYRHWGSVSHVLRYEKQTLTKTIHRTETESALTYQRRWGWRWADQTAWAWSKHVAKYRVRSVFQQVKKHQWWKLLE